MKFKVLLLVVALAVLGGGGYAVRQYMHNADPTVRAERLEGEGRLREALVELRTAARANPKDAELHVRMAQVQSKLADPVAAEKEFRTAIQLGADRTLVIPQLGESMLVQGRFRDVLRDVPARGPDAALLARALQLRALAQLSLDDLPAAQATSKDADARAPNQPETALIAARVAAAMNDAPLVRSKIADVLRMDPNQVEALLMQEKLSAIEGDRAGALALADRAVKAAPWSAMARIERASQYIFAGDDAQAQADVTAVLQAQPRFMDAVYLNGILMARRGQLTEAANQLEKLDGVAGRLPQGLYFQSLIAAQQGNLQTAADFARRYYTLAPTDTEAARQLARTELALNRPAGAVPALTKAVAVLPKDAELQDLLGRSYAALGRGPEAAAALSAAMALAPENSSYRFHLGAQQLQTGRIAEALANLGQAFDADPKIPGLGLALVSASLAANDPAKAESVLGRIRTATGETEDTMALSAAVRIRQGDLPAARALLTEAARKYPNSLDLRVQLAQLMVQQGQGAEAAGVLGTVLATQPAKISALGAYIRLKAQDNDLPAAIKALDTAHRSAPRDLVVATMLADALTSGGDPKHAVDVLMDTGAGDALPALAAGALARAQLAAGRPADAKATYRRILAESPDDLTARGALATLLNNEKDFAGVRALLQDALARAPGNYSLMSGLVANEVRWKDVDAGSKLADEMQRMPDAMPYAAALKGDLYLTVNRPADAAAAYTASYNANPSLPLLIKATGALSLAQQPDTATVLLKAWLKDHPTDADAAQRLAQLDLAAERYPEAQANLAITLAAAPDNAMALNNLAWAYFMTGDRRALPTAQKSYLQEPNASSGDTLGWILVKTGSARAAVPLLQRAQGLRPDDRGIQYHLAAALVDDNRVNEARAVLQPLVDGPAFADQAAARALAERIRSK